MKRIYSFFLISFFCAMLLSCITGQKIVKVGVSKDSIAFVVSTEGNDAWSGTMIAPNSDRSDGPLHSVEKVQEKIRELKKEGKLTLPVTVYLRGGFYSLDKPWIFSPDDSGSAAYPVTYTAYPDEQPVISGGMRLTGWETAEGKKRKAALPSFNGKPLQPRQLFINGERRQRAKSPNEGFYKTNGMISNEANAKLKYRENDILPTWGSRNNVEIFTIGKWAESRIPILSVSETTKIATLSGKINDWIQENNQRYWVENAIECLDQPGEWFLDVSKNNILYIPALRENIDTQEAVIPALKQLVLLQGDPENQRFVEYINLEGMIFSHTDWDLPPTGYADVQAAVDIPAAIAAVGANNCKIAKCLIAHTGNYAIEFGKGCKNNIISGNEMTDLGAGGVRIGEPGLQTSNDLLTMRNTVSDNRIHDIGKVYTGAVGVWIGQSGYNLIAHNEIYDTWYTAISNGWTWGYGLTNTHFNTIEYNSLYNIGRGLLSDMGAIYTLGIQNGTVIRNNVIHDVDSFDYGGWGIYPDEGSSFILIENNITYRTKSAGFHQHYGKKNIVQNNIFAFGKEKQIMRTRMEEHQSFSFEKNIVYWDTGDLLGSNWKDDQYLFDNNIYWDASGKEVRFDQWSFADWKKRGMDVHSIIADPLFADPKKYDFRFKPGSPVLLMGFQPIDIKTVGPREELIRPKD